MNKNSLVPERRVNKLGHVVTKHVRASPSGAGGNAALPAPQIAAKPVKKAKLKPPTSKQLARVVGSHGPVPFTADARLALALGSYSHAERGPSDVTLFNLFSVVSPDDAMAFTSVGIEDYRDVPGLLEKHGLTDLLVDRRELMDLAISMRVKPEAMLMLSRRYPMDAYDPEVYATAALLAGSPSERTIGQGTDEEARLHDSILTKEVSFEDVQTLGTRYLLKPLTHVDRIHKALRARKLDGARYSAEYIKHVDIYGRMYGDFERGLQLSEVYGDDFMLGIKGIDGVLTIERDYADKPLEYRRELVLYQEKALASEKENQYGYVIGLVDLYERAVDPSYFNAIHKATSPYSAQVPAADIIDAYEGGVPADYLISMMEKGKTVANVVDSYKNNVGLPIAEGWL